MNHGLDIINSFEGTIDLFLRVHFCNILDTFVDHVFSDFALVEINKKDHTQGEFHRRRRIDANEVAGIVNNLGLIKLFLFILGS